MHKSLVLIAVLATLPCWVPSANAQSPALPATIKLIVPSSAGGVHDVIGRLWAERMKASLGTLVIDNRGGAGGIIALTEAARAPADGATLVLGSNSTHILTPLVWKASGKALSFDPVRDFEVITVFAGTATAIAVTPGLPVRTLAELAAHARANPDKLTYAHGGVGAISHVAAEMFKQLGSALALERESKIPGKLEVRPVPYRGMGPAQVDVINGTISMFVPNITGQVVELHQTGRIRLLSVNSPKRHPSLPAIPTASEAGLPGMITENVFAIFAPAGISKALVDRINEASRAALADTQFQDRLALSAFDAIPGLDAAKSAAYLRDEHARWEAIIKAAGIRE